MKVFIFFFFVVCTVFVMCRTLCKAYALYGVCLSFCEFYLQFSPVQQVTAMGKCRDALKKYGHVKSSPFRRSGSNDDQCVEVAPGSTDGDARALTLRSKHALEDRCLDPFTARVGRLLTRRRRVTFWKLIDVTISPTLTGSENS